MVAQSDDRRTVPLAFIGAAVAMALALAAMRPLLLVAVCGYWVMVMVVPALRLLILAATSALVFAAGS